MIGKRSKQTKRNPKTILTEFETNREPKRERRHLISIIPQTQWINPHWKNHSPSLQQSNKR